MWSIVMPLAGIFFHHRRSNCLSFIYHYYLIIECIKRMVEINVLLLIGFVLLSIVCFLLIRYYKGNLLHHYMDISIIIVIITIIIRSYGNMGCKYYSIHIMGIRFCWYIVITIWFISSWGIVKYIVYYY